MRDFVQLDKKKSFFEKLSEKVKLFAKKTVYIYGGRKKCSSRYNLLSLNSKYAGFSVFAENPALFC